MVKDPKITKTPWSMSVQTWIKAWFKAKEELMNIRASDMLDDALVHYIEAEDKDNANLKGLANRVKPKEIYFGMNSHIHVMHRANEPPTAIDTITGERVAYEGPVVEALLPGPGDRILTPDDIDELIEIASECEQEQDRQ
jgi:hypothetical protein